MNELRVLLEIGSKRVIASALDWPGWCRGGRGEEDALAALVAAAPRYAAIVSPAGLPFDPPQGVADLQVVERAAGNATTDYGVPDAVAAGEAEPMDATELARAESILRACWRAFDETCAKAVGQELTRGPRGGGRELEGIQRHVLDAEAGYAARIAIQLHPVEPGDAAAVAARRERLLAGLAGIAPVGAPPPGPRGGKRWPPRYFVRRVAYHLTDHILEIQNRLPE
jgi:hypothetical protein